MPKSHFKTDGEAYFLPVVVFESLRENRKPDPIVFLNGGPGMASVGTPRFTEALWEDSLTEDFWSWDRDLIIFDMRGTGGARPGFDCPDVIKAIGFHSSDERWDRAVEDCHRVLRQKKSDFQSFNALEAALDLAYIREALKIEEWNLWGVSYGTRIARLYMEQEPEFVRSAILEGTLGPEISKPARIIAGFHESLQRTLTHCSKNSECRRVYPNLESLLHDALASLETSPISLKLELTRQSGERHFSFDNNDLLDLLFLSLLQPRRCVPPAKTYR